MCAATCKKLAAEFASFKLAFSIAIKRPIDPSYFDIDVSNGRNYVYDFTILG